MKKVTLQDIAKVQTGRTPPTSNKDNFDGKINWYTPEDLKQKYLNKSNRTITELGLNTIPVVEKNSILISCVGEIGNLGIVTSKSGCNQQFCFLSDLKLPLEYTYYLLQKNVDKLNKSSHKNVLPLLPLNDLKQINFQIHKKTNTQQKIGCFLNTH